MQPTTIDESDTSWRRHFEPLLFCIHCANAVWIVRIFILNNNHITNNYFEDLFFKIGLIVSISLLGFRWYLYLFQKYEITFDSTIKLRQAMAKCFSYLLSDSPYFIRIMPNDEIMEKNAKIAFDKNNQTYKATTNLSLYFAFTYDKKFIALHLLFLIIGFISIGLKLPPSIIGKFFINNNYLYGLFHVIVIGMCIKSFLFLFFNFIRNSHATKSH